MEELFSQAFWLLGSIISNDRCFTSVRNLSGMKVINGVNFSKILSIPISDGNHFVGNGLPKERYNRNQIVKLLTPFSLVGWRNRSKKIGLRASLGLQESPCRPHHSHHTQWSTGRSIHSPYSCGEWMEHALVDPCTVAFTASYSHTFEENLTKP